MIILSLFEFKIVSSVAPVLLSAAGTEKEFKWLTILIVSLVIGLLVGLIRTLSAKGKLTSVFKQDAATDYTKKDSFKVTVSREIFMYSDTDRREKPKQVSEEN